MPSMEAALLGLKRLPRLGERRYQTWSAWLHAKPQTFRLAVAESLYFRERDHRRGLGLFLACVYPVAKLVTDRVAASYTGAGGRETTGELMFNEAVNDAIAFFRSGEREGLEFRPALYRRLKLAAFSAISSRDEHSGITYRASVDRIGVPAAPRTVELLSAKQMLDRIATLETDPARIGAFLERVMAIGPDALLPHTWNNHTGTRRRFIDYQEVCDKLGITYHTACRYFVMARKILRQSFNSDGTLFVKTAATAQIKRVA